MMLALISKLIYNVPMTNTYLFRLAEMDKRNRKTVEAYVRKQLGIKVPFRDILSAMLAEGAEQAKKAN